MSTELRPAGSDSGQFRSPDSFHQDHSVTGADSAPDSCVHYDLPAGVFELLLDRNMNYSSGWYARGDEDLDTAQIDKMARIARYAGLGTGSRVLDLGLG